MKEPRQRPFAGVDLRRPKGYPAAPAEAATEVHGDDPCPRCESRDTKFCYYNNYNTSQPRHYCRACRRYWTKGGSLRNVPVGGGSRKTASSSSSSSSSAASPKRAKNSKRRRVALAAPPPPEPEPGTTEAAENEAMAGTIGYPATDVDAARDTANGTVTVGYPATAVDAARDTANGTVTVGDPATDVDAARDMANGPVAVGDPANAVDAGRVEATANGTVDDHVIAADASPSEATANGAVDGPATVVDAARTEATADGAKDLPGAAPAVDDRGLTDHPSFTPGVGLADAGGKDAPDLSPFEWPSGCDLGSYWAPGVYADTDPVLFLNLP